MLTQGVVVFLYSFVSKRKHILATLLSLEGFMLCVFLLLGYYSVKTSYYNFVLVFLTMVACEGVLGLSLLVLIVRNHGNDYFKSMNSLLC
nr:NADH dehydrogenase subunit 4L [Sida crystallina]